MYKNNNAVQKVMYAVKRMQNALGVPKMENLLPGAVTQGKLYRDGRI